MLLGMHPITQLLCSKMTKGDQVILSDIWHSTELRKNLWNQLQVSYSSCEFLRSLFLQEVNDQWTSTDCVSDRILAIWKCLKQMNKWLCYEYAIMVHSSVPSHMLDPGPGIPLSCFLPHCYRSLSYHEYFLFYNIFLSHISFSLHPRYYVLHYNASLMSLYLCLSLSLTCKLFYEILGLALYLTHSSYKVNHYYVVYEMT